MKRNLLILLLGIGFLLVMTWAGAILPDLLPQRQSARVQTAQAGPYEVTLQVDPNPPHITRPTTLSLQIVRRDTQQLVDHARVTLASNMETMDMGTAQATAQWQGNGTYQAQAQFSMSGPWRLLISIAVPGARTEQATFEVTAQ